MKASRSSTHGAAVVAMIAIVSGCAVAPRALPQAESVLQKSVVIGSVDAAFAEPSAIWHGDTAIVAAIRFYPDSSDRTGFMASPGRFTCEVFAADSPASDWERSPDLPVSDCGDPWLARSLHEVYLGSVGSAPGNAAGLWVFRTTPGTWERALHAIGTYDHPTLVTYGDTLIMAAGRMAGAAVVLRSVPGVDSVYSTLLGPDSQPQFANQPVILVDGTILVPYTDYETVYVRRSVNGGRTYGEPVVVAADCDDPFHSVASQGQSVRLACTDSDGRVLLYGSDDAGSEWSLRWASMIDGERGTPTVTGLDNGRFLIVWQERDSRQCLRLMGAISEPIVAGTPMQLDAALSCPGLAKRFSYLMDRFPFGGDYIGLASRAGRTLIVRPQWSATTEGGPGLRIIIRQF